MASTEFVEPYIDLEAGLLRNKLGAQTKVTLDEAEGDFAFARLMQLTDHPQKATGDLDELRATPVEVHYPTENFSGSRRGRDCV